MRHLFAAGHNDTAEHARLTRKVAERRAMYDSFGDHSSEVQLRLAELALERFQRAQQAHLPTEPAA